MSTVHTNERTARRSIALWAGAFLWLAALGTSGTLLLDASPAHAVIGRPLTPGSYAGVARRTSRRTSRRTVARTTPYATSIPAGCTMVGGVYQCGGGAAYRPYYEGPNVVYVQEPR